MLRVLHFISMLILFGSVSSVFAYQKRPVRIRLDEHSFVALSKQRGPHLDVRVKDKARLNQTVKLYTGRFSEKSFSLAAYKISKLSATRAFVPYIALSPGFKRAFLSKLWPDDRVEGRFLLHKVVHHTETLWTIAQMYTGFGNNYKEIQRVSGMRKSKLKLGMTLKVPYKLLMSLLKDAHGRGDVASTAPDLPESEIGANRQVPVISGPGAGDPLDESVDESVDETPPAKEAPSLPQQKPAKVAVKPTGLEQQLEALTLVRAELSYGRDKKGAYALYRLKKGEAIYSAVVVRFCGLVRAPDVNRLSKEIIARNNIRDVTDMAIGTSIRIPYENLQEEFKADDDDLYLGYLRNLEAVSRIATKVETRNLEGIYIILDAGHGGRDPGADRRRIWEDDFVYDILCRIKARLEAETSAVVLTTIMDPSVMFKVQDVTLFRRDKDELLLTSPRYRLSSSKATVDGVNLRWMFANNRFQQYKKKGVSSANFLFASFHADALHRSIRGTMLYVPDARHYPRKVVSPPRLARFKESLGSTFNFSLKNMQKAQARSTNFANNYVMHAKKMGMLVHRQKPIRSLIYRNPTQPFVPAVLKFNRIPTRVLIEICNLNNKKDQDLLKRPDFRQKVADAFIASVLTTYGAGNTSRGSAGG